jgi:hypothetical protein
MRMDGLNSVFHSHAFANVKRAFLSYLYFILCKREMFAVNVISNLSFSFSLQRDYLNTKLSR